MTTEIATLFPNGLQVRVRTGAKDGDKHVVGLVTTHPDKWSDDFMRLAIESGARAIIAEKANTVPTEGGEKFRWAQAVFADADKGEMPKGCTPQERVSRADTMPPLDRAIFRGASDWITGKLLDKARAGDVKGSGKNGRVVAADFAGIAKGGALESLFVKGELDSTKVVAFAREKLPNVVKAAEALVADETLEGIDV